MTLDVRDYRDREEAASIWSESFGDDREVIDAVLDGFGDGTRLYLGRTDGETAAFAAAVPITARFSKDGAVRDYRGAYLYAVCVRPDFRGKGVCRAFSKAMCEHLARDFDFAMLIPASEGLFEMYRKDGFTDELSGLYPFYVKTKEPARFAPTVLDAVGAVLADEGDTDALYELYRNVRDSGGLLKNPHQFRRALDDFTASCHAEGQSGGAAFLTLDSERIGYVIYAGNPADPDEAAALDPVVFRRGRGQFINFSEKSINIYDICCYPEKKTGIIKNIYARLSAGASKKALCRRFTGDMPPFPAENPLYFADILFEG